MVKLQNLVTLVPALMLSSIQVPVDVCWRALVLATVLSVNSTALAMTDIPPKAGDGHPKRLALNNQSLQRPPDCSVPDELEFEPYCECLPKSQLCVRWREMLESESQNGR